EETLDALRRFLHSRAGESILERDAAVLLAVHGTDDDRRRMARADAAPMGYWVTWARRDPESFLDWRRTFSEQLEQPPSDRLLEAWARVAPADDIAELLDVLRSVELDDSARERVLVALESRVRGLRFFAQLEPEGAPGDVLAEVYDRLADTGADLGWLDPETCRDWSEELGGAVADGDWADASARAVEIVDAMRERADVELAYPSGEALSALVDAVRPAGRGEGPARWEAGLALDLALTALGEFALLEALTGARTIEEVLDLRRRFVLPTAPFESRLQSVWQRELQQEDESTARGAVRDWIVDCAEESVPGGVLDSVAQLEGLSLLELGLDVLEERPDLGNTQLAEAVAEELGAEPARLRADASDLLTGRGRAVRAAALEALRDRTERWASGAVLDAFDELLVERSSGVWSCLRELGDPRALNPTVEAWREGEHHVAEVAVFLASLDERRESLPEALVDDAAEAATRRHSGADWSTGEDAVEALYDEWGEEELQVELRCLECDRRYNYEVEQLYIDPEALDDESGVEDYFRNAIVSRIVECKNCGALDRYELTERNRSRLTSTILPILMEEDPDWGESPLVPAKLRLGDGTDIERPAEGIETLRHRAEAAEDDSTLWRRLGNFCDRFGREDDARSAWRTACEVDETEVHAPYQLADSLWFEGDLDAAIGRLLEALERMPKADLPKPARERIAEELADFLRQAADLNDEPLVLRAAWTPAEGRGLDIESGTAVVGEIENWKRFESLLAKNFFHVVSFDHEPPEESPTPLQKLIEQEAS
ncbi:MAG: hypothetical protein ABEL76_11030, partial [Bradymonadaceae bacterium]